MPARECSRTACSKPAVSSLTFVYEDSTAVLGPLSRLSEPHAYDLCREHASRMTAPRGWELLRVAGAEPVGDDLVALADAVSPRSAVPEDAPVRGGARGSAAREPAGREHAVRGPERSRRTPPGEQTPARHLHVLRSPHD